MYAVEPVNAKTSLVLGLKIADTSYICSVHASVMNNTSKMINLRPFFYWFLNPNFWSYFLLESYSIGFCRNVGFRKTAISTNRIFLCKSYLFPTIPTLSLYFSYLQGGFLKRFEQILWSLNRDSNFAKSRKDSFV